MTLGQAVAEICKSFQSNQTDGQHLPTLYRITKPEYALERAILLDVLRSLESPSTVEDGRTTVYDT